VDAEDEAGLIEEARRGSEAAFAQLVRRHQAQVRACIARHVRDLDAVDDLAQETFLRAYRALSGWRGESSLRLWLLSIARNRAFTYLAEEARRRSREGESLESALARWSAPSEDDPAVDERELSALRACVEGLGGPGGALVLEFYFRRRSAGEIARDSGRSEGAVWMALLRVRQALRRCVESRLSGGGRG
jgi:RNA polymerase sigma-70 factor (ECF subfamily)